MKRRISFLVMISTLMVFSPFIQLQAQQIVKLKAHRFAGDKKDDSMWSGMYTAKSGKISIGLCTHADAANFYEFDPTSEKMGHIADLTIFKGERGQGIRTSGKIHVVFVEDKEGNITMISENSGLLGMTIDQERRRLYGLGEDGHLYMFDMDKLSF